MDARTALNRAAFPVQIQEQAGRWGSDENTLNQPGPSFQGLVLVMCKGQPDRLFQPFHFQGDPVDELVPYLDGPGNTAGLSQHLGIQGMAFRQFRVVVVHEKGTAKCVIHIFLLQCKKGLLGQGFRTGDRCNRKMDKLCCWG